MTDSQLSYDFYRIAKTLHDSLHTGDVERSRTVKALLAAETPEGPRVDWLRNTADQILRVLKKQAELYNEKHPQQRISKNDFFDALSTTYGWLKDAK